MKPIWIILDNGPFTYGSGTALTDSDNPFIGNIGGNWTLNGSSNILNASAAEITYQAQGFTAHPVRLVENKGDTTYLSPATVFGNLTLMTAPDGHPDLSADNINIGSLNKLSACIAGIDPTPRKADGSYATTDGEPYDGTNADDANAAYYEISVPYYNKITTDYDYAGVYFDLISKLSTGTFGVERGLVGFIFFDEATQQIVDVDTSAGVCFVATKNSSTYEYSLYEMPAGDLEVTDSNNKSILVSTSRANMPQGDTIGFEISPAGVALIDRSSGFIEKNTTVTKYSVTNLSGIKLLPIINLSLRNDCTMTIDNIQVLN
ncbi:MAG: hypothetical protein ACQETE_01545 [Bacteroidota bacterium]